MPNGRVRPREVLARALAMRDLRMTILGIAGLASLLLGIGSLHLPLVLIGVGLLFFLAAFVVPFAWMDVVHDQDPDRSFGWTDLAVIAPLAVIAVGCIAVALAIH